MVIKLKADHLHSSRRNETCPAPGIGALKCNDPTRGRVEDEGAAQAPFTIGVLHHSNDELVWIQDPRTVHFSDFLCVVSTRRAIPKFQNHTVDNAAHYPTYLSDSSLDCCLRTSCQKGSFARRCWCWSLLVLRTSQKPWMSQRTSKIKPLVRADGQQPAYECLALCGDKLPRWTLEDVRHSLFVSFRLHTPDVEWHAATQHRIQHHAEAPEVDSLIIPFHQDLRRHIGRCPHSGHPRARSPCLAKDFGQTKICDLDIVQLTRRLHGIQPRALDEDVLEF
mmetsp:Transcript_131054/g.339398  ORF Transcript_131054/g.339398 Transcript_131054/m.339398 type:complete len:279 (-) Transcript_131054:408-1244(-)